MLMVLCRIEANINKMLSKSIKNIAEPKYDSLNELTTNVITLLSLMECD